jgi:hypothetical protein
MGLLDEMMGGLINKEKATFDTIQNALENISIELNCSHKDFFVIMKPVDEEFSPKFYIYLTQGNKFVREITIKEILTD